jgi:hypothetical protein
MQIYAAYEWHTGYFGDYLDTWSEYLFEQWCNEVPELRDRTLGKTAYLLSIMEKVTESLMLQRRLHSYNRPSPWW